MWMTTPPQRRLPGGTPRPAGSFGFDILEPAEFEPAELEPEEFEAFEFGPTWGERIRGWSRRSLVAIAWLGLAAVVAFGSAGVIAATEHFPQTGSRSELTWAADQALSKQLDAAVQDLLKMSGDVDVLGNMARKVRENLTQLNQLGLGAAYDDGSNALASIRQHAASVDRQLGCSTWTGARDIELAKINSSAVVHRLHKVCGARAAVAPLADDWNALVSGSKLVMQVIGDVNGHDAAAAEALQLAVKGRYEEALVKLGVADAAIADARTISDAFAMVTDVSTLDEWLTRYQGMDDALRLLWQMEQQSRGRPTPEVIAAMKVVNEAKALLPDSNSVMGIVTYEMSGQLTTDGIAIEVARGQFQALLGDLVGALVYGSP